MKNKWLINRNPENADCMLHQLEAPIQFSFNRLDSHIYTHSMSKTAQKCDLLIVLKINTFHIHFPMKSYRHVYCIGSQ